MKAKSQFIVDMAQAEQNVAVRELQIQGLELQAWTKSNKTHRHASLELSNYCSQPQAQTITKSNIYKTQVLV